MVQMHHFNPKVKMPSILMTSGCKLLIKIYFYYFKNTPKCPKVIILEPPVETETTKVDLWPL